MNADGFFSLSVLRFDTFRTRLVHEHVKNRFLQKNTRNDNSLVHEFVVPAHASDATIDTCLSIYYFLNSVLIGSKLHKKTSKISDHYNVRRCVRGWERCTNTILCVGVTNGRNMFVSKSMFSTVVRIRFITMPLRFIYSRRIYIIHTRRKRGTKRRSRKTKKKKTNKRIM